MGEHIEYSFEADVTRLLSGINQGIKALDEFSEVVELASTNFDLSNKELDKLTASLNRMKSPLGQLTKQFADFSAQVEKYSTGFNWVDQQIAQQEKSSKQFSTSLKSSMTEYAAFQKKVAAQQELFAKSQRKLAKKEEEAQKIRATAIQHVGEVIQQNGVIPTKGWKAALSSLNTTASNVFKSITNGATKATKSTSLLNGVTKMLHRTFGTLIGVKVGQFFANAATESIDYIESVNLMKVTFKDSKEEIEDFVETLSDMYLLDDTTIMEMAGSFKAMGNAVAMPVKASTELSESLTVMTADLASLLNLDIDTTFTSVQGAMRGMSKSAKQLNMDIRATTVEQFANSQGIKAQYETMSEAEREILRYCVMVNQARDANSDFANTLDEPANQLRTMKEQFKELGRAIGQFFIPMARLVLPVINGVIMAITELINLIASLTGFKIDWSSITGGSAGYQDTADSLDSIGESADSTSKKLKSMLAPFDELNVLSEDKGSGAVSSAASGYGEVDPAVLALLEQTKYELGEVESAATRAKNAILDFLGIKPTEDGWAYYPDIFEQHLIKYFPNWKKSIASLFDVDWSNVIAQLGSIAGSLWDIAGITLTNLVNDFLEIFGINDETLSASIENLTTNLEQLGTWIDEHKQLIADAITGITELYIAYKIFSGVANLPGFGLIRDLFSKLSKSIFNNSKDLTAWGTTMQGQFNLGTSNFDKFRSNMATGLGSLGAQFSGVFAAGIIASIALIVASFVNWLLTTEEGQETLGKIMETISSIFSHLGELVTTIIKGVVSIIEWMGEHFSSVFSNIGGVINGFLEVLDGVIQFITGVFSGDWETALNGLKDIAKGVFEAIANLLGGILNTAITALEDALNFIGDAFLDFARSLISKIPVYGYKWASKIPESFNITIPRVPPIEFAEGGVVTGPTRALIGEAGRSEAVIPLDNSPQMLNLIDKIADKVNSTGETIVKVYIGDREWDAFTYESAQRGSKLVGAQPIREGRA